MKLLASAGVTERSRPSAEYVAMAVAALCLGLFGVIHATTDVMVLSLLSVAPLVAATVADERRTAVFAGTAVALAIGAGWWDGATGQLAYWIRLRWSAPSARWRSWWQAFAAGVRSAWRG